MRSHVRLDPVSLATGPALWAAAGIVIGFYMFFRGFGLLRRKLVIQSVLVNRSQRRTRTGGDIGHSDRALQIFHPKTEPVEGEPSPAPHEGPGRRSFSYHLGSRRCWLQGPAFYSAICILGWPNPNPQLSLHLADSTGLFIAATACTKPDSAKRRKLSLTAHLATA